MKARSITLLFIADIVGDPGMRVTRKVLRKLKSDYDVDLCIANGENVSGGKGIVKRDADRMFELGIDVITTGNHFYDKSNMIVRLRNYDNILRPANYPDSNEGHGWVTYELPFGQKVGIINLQGRTFMAPIDCPFRKADDIIRRLSKDTNIIIVDFHAEATAEKKTIAYYLDGKVSALIGTHTHVQTADEIILPNGTAYITDAGMTGPVDSVIGLRKDIAIKRFTRHTPFRYEMAEGRSHFNGVVVEIDTHSGKSLNIKRLFIDEDNIDD